MTKVDRHVFLAVFLAVSLAACGGDEKPSGVMAREKFVAANVAVRTLPKNATDADRAAALKKQRVTEKQMKAWVNAHARDAETLSLTWEEIAKKVDSLTTQPVTPPGAAGEGPPPSLGGPPTIAPQSVPPGVRPRKDSLANIAPGGRRLGVPRPGLPPLRRPPSEQDRRSPPPSNVPQDPRVAPVQAPVAPPPRPARPPR